MKWTLLRPAAKKHEVGIDADSGQLLYRQTETAGRPFPAAAVSLQQAMQTVQAYTGGRVKDAESDRQDGVPHYEIKTVAPNGAKQKVWIDSATGRLMTAAGHPHD